MRTIKFRGKCAFSGVWRYGYFYISKGNSIIRDENDNESIVIPESVGQFTGRTDAEFDGLEVYENDFIENCDTKDLQVVYWNEKKASWYCRYVDDESRIVSLSDSLGNLNKVIKKPKLL